MPRDAVSRTAPVGTVGRNGLSIDDPLPRIHVKRSFGSLIDHARKHIKWRYVFQNFISSNLNKAVIIYCNSIYIYYNKHVPNIDIHLYLNLFWRRFEFHNSWSYFLTISWLSSISRRND